MKPRRMSLSRGRPVLERGEVDGFSPIRGKCNFWRERLVEDDKWDPRVKKSDKRVECSCFVEGYVWTVTASTIPRDCPVWGSCRYYVKNA